MKVIIAGSRSKFLTNPFQVSIAVHTRLRQLPVGSIIVHGASPGGGVDQMAHQAAKTLGLHVVAVPINDSDRNVASFRPKFAPLARTMRMFDEHPDAELVLVWHAQHSPGTSFTIKEAERRRVPLEVYRV